MIPIKQQSKKIIQINLEIKLNNKGKKKKTLK